MSNIGHARDFRAVVKNGGPKGLTRDLVFSSANGIGLDPAEVELLIESFLGVDKMRWISRDGVDHLVDSLFITATT